MAWVNLLTGRTETSQMNTMPLSEGLCKLVCSLPFTNCTCIRGTVPMFVCGVQWGKIVPAEVT